MELSVLGRIKSRMDISGFTLIEVLVSVILLAVMLVMLAGVFDVYNKSYTRSTSSMQTYDDVRTIVSLMSHDLSAAMVRTNANRILNFSVSGTAGGVEIFMAVPDPKLQSLTNMSFTSHIAYFWQTNTYQVYRAIYNTQLYPQSLINTASSASNTDFTANASRLQNMTLAYSSGSPGNWFNWTTDPNMVAAMNTATNLPILRNVLTFNVLCYSWDDTGNSASATVTTNTWQDGTRLPRYIKLQFGVANDKDAAAVKRNPSLTNLLENFEVTVPMVNYGVTNNNYAPQ
jgi:prepilin-type N-terminal cleavage/methylation domain-containing protein